MTPVSRVAITCCAVFALSPMSLLATAAERSNSKGKPAQDAAEKVEMFEAMKQGDIEVKFIPKNDREGRVQIKNKTDKPLSVRLPDAFAAVPVLAQRPGGGGGAGRGNNANNQNNQNQAMGGGMGGGMMGGMGGGGMGGMGGGMFNVPPERVADFKVPLVCLEHGKKPPRASIPYEITKLESVTSKPGVAELLAMLAGHRIGQRAAQAAAWHLANDMSWEQLAAKRVEHVGAPSEPYFQPQELRAAFNLAQQAVAQAKQQPVKSPGEVSSLSQNQ